MVIIVIGADVTRYFGSEGMMGIREGSASNSFLSRETYLLFQVQHGGQKFSFDEPVLFLRASVLKLLNTEVRRHGETVYPNLLFISISTPFAKTASAIRRRQRYTPGHWAAPPARCFR